MYKRQPQDIDRLYAYKESLPENKQFILENNKETLAQVFTDVRYTKKDSEAMAKGTPRPDCCGL